MKKSDVKLHGDFLRQGYPAVNIKVYRMDWSNDTIEKQFECDSATAEQAGQFAFESAQEQFWETMPEVAKEVFGTVKVYSGGRSGGWLEVHGLPDVETWDAIQLGKWAKFERMVNGEVKYLTSWARIKESIKSNQWHKPGSEAYNFIDRNGETVCIADLKQQAVKAGYGPVVR